jgi:lysozyme family protein
MNSFERAVTIILEQEGGYVNDPNDPGGETNYGISKRAYPDEDIKAMSAERAKAIYRRDYWAKCRCDNLHWPLSLFVFDCAVNQGVSAAIKLLQGILTLKPDGIIGHVTINAALKLNDKKLTYACGLYMTERAMRYAQNENFQRYGRGWMKRLFLVILEGMA